MRHKIFRKAVTQCEGCPAGFKKSWGTRYSYSGHCDELNKSVECHPMEGVPEECPLDDYIDEEEE